MVLVDHAAETLSALDGSVHRDDAGWIVVGWQLLPALMRAVIIEVVHVLADHREGVSFAVSQQPVGGSSCAAPRDAHRVARARRLITGLGSRVFDTQLYKQRNVVERCFNRLKQCRSVATRYDKTAKSYQATVMPGPVPARHIWGEVLRRLRLVACRTSGRSAWRIVSRLYPVTLCRSTGRQPAV